jgi:hypothetical protein
MDYSKAAKAVADYNAKLASGKKHTPNQIAKYNLAQEYFAEKEAERAAFKKHVRG